MGAIISLISERNIVFHVVEFSSRLLRRRTVARGLGRGTRAAARLIRHLARRAAAFAPAEHLHHVATDLGRVVRLAVLVVLARAQAAFDIDLAALLQVLAGDFREPAPEADPVPLGL